MSFIKANIRVKKIKWKGHELAKQLAHAPTIQAGIQRKAGSAAAEAITRVAASPQKRINKQRHHGRYFSEKPSAVAATIKVGGSKGPFIVTTTSRGLAMPVALVVADHPYSIYYRAPFASAIRAQAGPGWKFQG